VAIGLLSNSNNDVTTGALATLVLTPATAITASNVVVIAVAFSDATSSVAGIAANTTAGTWNRVTGYPLRGAGGAAVSLELWWGTGATGTTITVTATAAVNYWCAFATALSGASTAAIGATNKATASNAATGYTARSGTATPTETGDYALGYYADAASSIATLALDSTISPGLTQGYIETNAVNSSIAYGAVSGTTAQEAGWDVTGAPASTASAAAVLLVKPAATVGTQALAGSGASASRASGVLTKTAASSSNALSGSGASLSRGSASLTQTVAGTGTTYYVAANGNDALAGTSPATAWATIDHLNNYALNPGDSVLFNRGDTFTVTTSGGVNSNYGGTTGKPITWGAYGTGAQPIISGGASFTGGWAATGTANVYSIAQASYVGGLLYGGVWALANRNNGGTGTITTLAAMNTPSWWWSGGTLYLHTPDSLATANGKAIIVNNQADLLNIDVSSATNKGPVTLQGLEFRYSSDATLYLNGFTGKVTVSGCTFKYCGWGTSETTGQGAIAYISNSTGGGRVTACTFDSIEATPLYATNAPQVDFDTNTVTNITGSWLTGGANGVEYEAGSTGGNVYNNSFIMTNIGPSAVTNQSPKGCITFAGSGTPGTSLHSTCYGNTTNGGAWGISASNCNIDVHDNLCQNHTGTTEINYAAGLYFGPGFSSVPTVDNVRLYRNRVVNCRYSVYLAGDAGVVYTGLLVAHNTFANTSAQQGNIYAALPVAGIFENNIYSGPSDTGYLIALAAGVTSGKTLTQDYELVGANRAAGFNLNGTTYATLAAYLTATNAASTHGVVGNPLFVSAPSNLTLGSGSPAIDAGVVIAGINDGTAGSTRYLGTAPDLGYAETTPAQAFIGSAASGTSAAAPLTQTATTGSNALSGASASASMGSGALTQGAATGTNTLIGAGAGTSAASAALTQSTAPALALTGSGASGSTGSGTLTQSAATGTNALVGTGTSASSATGAATQTIAPALALTGNGTSASAGASSLTQTAATGSNALSGTGASASAGTGALTQAAASGANTLTGAASSGSTGAGSLTQVAIGTNSFVGMGASSSSGTAALTQTPVGALALVGSGASLSAGTSSLAQAGTPALALTGGAVSASAATGALTSAAVGSNALVGSGASASGAGAALTQIPAPALVLSGTATSGSTGAAPLTLAAPGALALAGNGASASSATAALTLTTSGLALSGSAVSGSGASGGLTQTPATGSNALAGSAASSTGSSVVLTQTPPPTLVLVGIGVSQTQGAAILAQSNAPLLALVGRAASASGGIAALTISVVAPTIPAQVLTSDEAHVVVTVSDEARATVTISDEARTLVVVGDAI